MKEDTQSAEDRAFVAKMRDAYAPSPIDADRFDAALQARLAAPTRRRGWVWGAWLGGALAAAAAVILLWPSAVVPPAVDAPAPQIAAVTPSVESSAAASTLPAESTWLAAMEYEPESATDELAGLPDDYTELADFLEL